MKIRSITLIGLLSAFVLTPLLAFANTVNHIQVQNGIIAARPVYSPAVQIDFYNTEMGKTPCYSRVVQSEQQSDDYAGGGNAVCATFGKVVITPMVTDPQAFSRAPITVIPDFNGKINVTINLQAATQPVFNPDGSIGTPGTVRHTETPWVAH